MNEKNASRKLLGKWDFWILLVILLAAAAFFLLPRQRGTAARITRDGIVLETIDLTRVTEPYDIAVPGEYPAVIRVEPGCVYFKEAACHDQVCVRTGRLTLSGQAAVCLPGKIAVQVTGGEKEYDAYTGV